jgi:hypothetical protein
VRDDAKEILDRARAKLGQLAGIEKIFEADAHKRDKAFEPLRHMCPTAPRSTQAPEKTELEIMQRNFDDWETWLNGHLKNFAQMIGEEIGETDKAVNARLAALEQTIGEMKAEQAVTRAAAEIVDLPNWRKQSDSAA